jgi:hypothetical protein
MLHTETAQNLGLGLWYLPQVFDDQTYREIRRCYRETATQWQCLYPNRLMSLPNNPDYSYLADVALDVTLAVSELTGHQLHPLNQEIFVDLPGHQLTWHFDDYNYKVLLQIYCGDVAQLNMGTQWYLGDKNSDLFSQYGANSIVNVKGLDIVETAYAPNAGYINDNSIKKAHGTRRIAAGLSRESVLFTFGEK